MKRYCPPITYPRSTARQAASSWPSRKCDRPCPSRRNPASDSSNNLDLACTRTKSVPLLPQYINGPSGKRLSYNPGICSRKCSDKSWAFTYGANLRTAPIASFPGRIRTCLFVHWDVILSSLQSLQKIPVNHQGTVLQELQLLPNHQPEPALDPETTGRSDKSGCNIGRRRFRTGRRRLEDTSQGMTGSSEPEA